MKPWMALVMLCAGCGGARVRTVPGSESVSSFDLRDARIVDLTYAFSDRTLYWPTSPSGFELRSLSRGTTEGGYFYSANLLCAPEHGGTHLDAPIHFAEAGESVDQIPVERFVGPLAVIDVRTEAAADRDYRLTPTAIEAFEARNGTIPAGATVAMYTGWGARYGDRAAYFGDDTPGDVRHLHFPGFGEAAARLLVARGVAAIGLDTPSVDHGPSSDFPVHRVIASANVLGLENLANLDQLPPTGALIVALPMKIEGGSGAPLRAIGLVPRSTTPAAPR